MSFYVAPAAPYLPSQWPLPMPVPYNPCVVFPGMGFNVAVPPLPPNAYMEPPSFVMLPAHVPLGDHRPPIPQYPPAQRFRRPANYFQKETVSMGVQTELSSLDRSDPQFSRPVEYTGSDSGRGTACSSSTPACSPASGVCLQVKNATPDGALGSGCVVRMGNGWKQRCSPLNELPAGEPCGGGNLVEHAASPSEALVSVHASSANEGDLCTDVEKQGDRQCTSPPTVQLGGGVPPPSTEMLPNLDRNGCEGMMSASAQKEEASQGVDCTEDGQFKIIKLPFSIQYIVDWKKMANQSVWSVESLALYVPSAEWMAQHGLLEPEEDNVMTSRCSKPQDATNLVDLGSEASSNGQRESISSVDSLPRCIPASSWLAEIGKMSHVSKLSSAPQEQGCIFRTPADIWDLRRLNLGCESHDAQKCRCGENLKWESSCQSATCTPAVTDTDGVQLLNGRKLHFWPCKNTDAVQRQVIHPFSEGARSQTCKACMRGESSLDVQLQQEAQEVDGSSRTEAQDGEVLLSGKEH